MLQASFPPTHCVPRLSYGCVALRASSCVGCPHGGVLLQACSQPSRSVCQSIRVRFGREIGHVASFISPYSLCSSSVVWLCGASCQLVCWLPPWWCAASSLQPALKISLPEHPGQVWQGDRACCKLHFPLLTVFLVCRMAVWRFVPARVLAAPMVVCCFK